MAPETAQAQISFATPGTDLSVPVYRGASAVGDFDGDGDLDLVASGRGELDVESIGLYENDGTGSFSEADADLNGVEDSAVSAGDFDSDGDLDLFVAGWDGNGFTAVFYENDGSDDLGTLFSSVDAGLPAFDSGSSSVGDFDGDGDLDLLLVGDGTGGYGGAIAHLFENDGSGDLATAFSHANAGLTGVEYSFSSVADFDGDHDLDLLLTGRDPDGEASARIYENDGSGDLSTAFTDVEADLMGTWYGNSSVGDFDGDGDIDFLLTGRLENFADVALVYENDGSGDLGTAFTDAEAGFSGVDYSSSNVADFDGDGDLDLLVTGQADDGGGKEGESLRIYENDGSGDLGTAFTDAEVEMTEVYYYGASSMGDFDGDGDIDLFVSGRYDYNPTAKVYENTSDNVAGTDVTIGDGTSYTPPAPSPGTDNNVLGRLSLSGASERAALKDLYLTVDGTHAGIERLSIWQSDNATFDPSTATERAGRAIDPTVALSETEAFLDLRLDIPETDTYVFVVANLTDDASGDLAMSLSSPDAVSLDLGTLTNATDDFPLALSSASLALPVELTRFTARRDGMGALLTWTTASEQDNAGFEVQRLVGEPGTGVYQPLGFVDGAGTTTQTHTYRFRVEDLPIGTHRFRLKQVDTDGSAQYSDTVPVRITLAEPYRLRAPRPNPTTGDARIRLAVEQRQAIRVAVYDLLGREVAVAFDGTLPAHTERSIPLSDGLPAGRYFIRVQGERFTATERLTVVR